MYCSVLSQPCSCRWFFTLTSLLLVWFGFKANLLVMGDIQLWGTCRLTWVMYSGLPQVPISTVYLIAWITNANSCIEPLALPTLGHCWPYWSEQVKVDWYIRSFILTTWLSLFQAAKASLVSSGPAASPPDLNTRLKQLINSAKCMLFMKGTPDAPRCGKS